MGCNTVPNSPNVDAVVIKDTSCFEDLPLALKKHGVRFDSALLNSDGWMYKAERDLALLNKIQSVGTPLGEYVDGNFYYGIKTGYNDAFVVDRETRVAKHKTKLKKAIKLLGLFCHIFSFSGKIKYC